MKNKLPNLKAICLGICSLIFAAIYGIDTGGYAKVTSGGERVYINKEADFLDYASRQGQYTIYVVSGISLSDTCYITSNKTVVGNFECGSLYGGPVVIENVSNVIIQNLYISNLIIGDGARHIWIDHCEASTRKTIQVSSGADSVTISRNYFRGGGNSCIIGDTISDGIQGSGMPRVTLHHNYFEGYYENYDVRVGNAAKCHLYNNFVQGIYDEETEIGKIIATNGGQVFAEKNRFWMCHYPFSIRYGHDSLGYLTEVGNKFIDCDSIITHGAVLPPTYSYTTDAPGDLWFQFDPGESYGANGLANAGGDYDGVGVKYDTISSNDYVLLAYHSGKALSVEGDGNIAQKTYDGSENMKFDIYTTYRFPIHEAVNWDYGSWLNTASYSLEDGTNVIASYEVDVPISGFFFQRVEDGLYRIISWANFKCLEVADSSMDDSANVQVATCREGYANQMFELHTFSSMSRGVDGANLISESDISLFPNPACAGVSLIVSEGLLEQAYTVEVFDLNQQTVIGRQYLFGGGNTLDVSGLKAGLYFVQIRTGQQVITKMLKKN